MDDPKTYSEPVQDIVGVIPSWITRWGITIIFSIFVFILIGCCFIRYPQTLSAPIIFVTSDRSLLEGILRIPPDGFSKISEGLEVVVRLQEYPDIEFGLLKGNVEKILRYPESGDDGGYYYTVKVSFTEDLISTYGIELPIVPGMIGESKVIVKDMRLIEYLLKPVKKLMHSL